MEFLLKSVLISSALYLFYKVFLQFETFFQSNRVYFLVGIILSILLPIWSIPIYLETESNVFLEAITTVNAIETDFVKPTNATTKSSFDWITILQQVYYIGVFVLCIKFIIELLSLIKLLKQTPKKKRNGYYLVEVDTKSAPFSFFKYIVYNKAHFSEEELNDILTHEKVHAFQFHTIDNILIQLLIILQWFNPFVWLYRKDLKQNLEYIADKKAQKKSKTRKNYQYLLLKASIKNNSFALSNDFYNSQLKKRIQMLQQNKTKKINQVKYALLIPLISLFLYSFTIKEIYQDKNGININSKGSIIVIDAGHGGEDSGATDSGTIEKEIVLQLSKEIKSLYKGAATILLTRNDDTFVSLQDRTDYINKLKPDLLISLHLNTSKNSQDNGIQMYVNAENKNYEKSKLAANNILHNFSEVALAKTSKIYNKNFTILRVNAPAVLLEIGFLSNNKDRNYLNSIKGQQEIAKSIIAFINGKPTVSSSQKGFGFPINKKDLEGMMSGYGMRIHPITKERKMHTGMDLSAKKGVAILAARHGVVTRAEFDKNYGNVVYIEHQNGFQTRYAHMKDIRIKKGAKVLQGSIVGTVGSTGKSLFPHLHFEILKDGNFVDPKNFY